MPARLTGQIWYLYLVALWNTACRGMDGILLKYDPNPAFSVSFCRQNAPIDPNAPPPRAKSPHRLRYSPRFTCVWVLNVKQAAAKVSS
jgi:hypothetical protein